MKNNKKLLIILEIIILIFIVAKAYQLINYNLDNKKTDEINKKAQEIIVKPVEEEKELLDNKDEEILEIKNVKEDIKEIYPDLVGYIEIPGTNISYPIVQGMDNDFYINHSVDKSRNANGSIFLDYRNNNFSDDNSILYGHHIKSGKFFFQLDKFRNQNFYNEYNKILINDNGELKEYIIYSVYIADPEEDYRIVDFNNLDEKEDFLQDIKSKSIIETKDIDYNIEDVKLITLSTCSDRGKNRLAVHGILVQ